VLALGHKHWQRLANIPADFASQQHPPTHFHAEKSKYLKTVIHDRDAQVAGRRKHRDLGLDAADRMERLCGKEAGLRHRRPSHVTWANRSGRLLQCLPLAFALQPGTIHLPVPQALAGQRRDEVGLRHAADNLRPVEDRDGIDPAGRQMRSGGMP